MTTAEAAKECLWLKQVPDQCLVKLMARPLTWVDDLSAHQLSGHFTIHQRTKHIDISVHFLREEVVKGNLELKDVISSLNIGDTLTKSLSRRRVKSLESKKMLEEV